MVKRPFDALHMFLNKNVKVGIKAGKEFEGKLITFDVHMNLVLTQVKDQDGKEAPMVFVRGDSVVYILPLEPIQ